MNGISDFNGVIEYIENNLTGEIRIEEMARLARMSVYEFRRIFSFVAGISVSEYVRRRRLSAAAAELLSTCRPVTELAIKYGYDTPSSFSRAFKEFHGISPTAMAKGGSKINLFTKISFDLQVRGGRDVSYEIRDDSGFSVRGYAGRSDLGDTECCEKVWDSFYSSGTAETAGADGQIYAAYLNGENCVDCVIGIRAKEGEIAIPSCRWACFTLNRTDDRYVNEFYKTLLFDWLSSSGLRRAEGIPNLEVYPADMETEGFEWEIRIPIERNERCVNF